MSKTSAPTSPGVSAATPTRGGTNSSPPMTTWRPTSVRHWPLSPGGSHSAKLVVAEFGSAAVAVVTIGEMPMRTPATKLDQRYSDPAAIATGWEETRGVLETAELFWISTVRADGRPHVTPVVAAWSDGAIWFSTGDGEQKYLNLLAPPHVVLTTGCAQWDRGLDVVVEGEAVRVTDDAVLARAAEAFTGKWDGRGKWVARG